MSSVESILAEAQELSPVERYELAMALLETIREPLGAPKAKRSKAASAASAEPKATRAPTSWNTGCAAVRTVIKTVEGYKPPHVMAFASFLKKANEAGWAQTEAEEMVAKYEAWLVDNSDVGSRSSGGSKASKAPKAEPTEEEKAAKRKLAAEKRKATMAAKKAAEAAEVAANVAAGLSADGYPLHTAEELEELEEDKRKPAPKPAPKKASKKDEAKYEVDGGADFTHDGVTYLRKKLALYDIKTEEFVGLWDPKAKTIDMEADEPEEE